MEKFSEKEMQRRLRHFEAVWRRVEALRSPRETAERCGVELKPRRRCGRGRPLPSSASRKIGG